MDLIGLLCWKILHLLWIQEYLHNLRISVQSVGPLSLHFSADIPKFLIPPKLGPR